jgi:hypothetical protein
MKPQALPPKAYSEIETVRLIWLAIFVSVFSFLFYNRHGDVLLYGDAVAHINIARRVFDSKTPGLLQLGTVWLPLPHLLIMPFIVSKHMWQTGAGGSMPSMAGFVLGVLGIFRLVRTIWKRDGEADGTTPIVAWAAVILYIANPNLIYMQATAMGESLYLALFIWELVHFVDFSAGNTKALTKCGLCLIGACLTRYDGWFMAAVLVVGVVLAKSRFSKQSKDRGPKSLATPLRGVVVWFILLAAAAPVCWLAYNAIVYRNPLEFSNGPYSAKAIEQQTITVNPAKGNLFAAGSYFLKAAELNVANSRWPGRLWLVLALLGSSVAWFDRRQRVALLLWAPLPFYALSIAFGSVPIFVPDWWPFSNYNVRYGLQLLPAFAVFVPIAISFLVQFAAKLPQVQDSWRPWAGTAMILGPLLLATLSYGAIWRSDPICYREATINMRGLASLDREVADWLKTFPPNSTILMYLGQHSGAAEQAGFNLKRIIYEGNHRVWKRPVDPDGLWERALADPAAYADYAIGFEGDPVWTAAKERHLTALVELHTTGQSPAIIFQGRIQGRVRRQTE